MFAPGAQTGCFRSRCFNQIAKQMGPQIPRCVAVCLSKWSNAVSVLPLHTVTFSLFHFSSSFLVPCHPNSLSTSTITTTSTLSQSRPPNLCTTTMKTTPSPDSVCKARPRIVRFVHGAEKCRCPGLLELFRHLCVSFWKTLAFGVAPCLSGQYSPLTYM